MKRSSWPPDVRRHRWIVDGHNVIFSHPALEPLQTGDQKGEARRRLEELFERFAANHGVEVQIVYDGNRMERNPDARRGGRVDTVYSLAPEEEADDRIVMIAERLVREGRSVVVVTSDRATLGARLPRSVLRVEPSELFRRMAGSSGDDRSRDGRPAGDFSDIEAHFLSLDAETPRPARSPKRRPVEERSVARPVTPVSSPPAQPVKRAPSPAPAPSPARETQREAKRARGQRAQQRRIEQLRGKSGKKAKSKGGR